jgi:hypothetical protein
MIAGSNYYKHVNYNGVNKEIFKHEQIKIFY